MKLVGRVVEMNIDGRYAYALCTHENIDHGFEILRLYRFLMPEPYKGKMSSLDFDNYRMIIKFPLKHCLGSPEFKLVGHVRVSAAEKALPRFRSVGLSKPDEMPSGWWIIDGDNEEWVDALTLKMMHYPDDDIPNLAEIKRIYDEDIYTHSIDVLQRGPLSFDPTRQN